MFKSLIKQLLNFDFLISILIFAIIGEYIPEDPLFLIIFGYWCYGVSLYYFDTKKINTYNPKQILYVLGLGVYFPYFFHFKRKK